MVMLMSWNVDLFIFIFLHTHSSTILNNDKYNNKNEQWHVFRFKHKGSIYGPVSLYTYSMGKKNVWHYLSTWTASHVQIEINSSL